MDKKKQMIVPFGKYKGNPVEVLEGDPSYVDWMLAQDGIKKRYPEFVSIVINNFNAPSETPEHNAIQVKFIKPEFCEKFTGFLDGVSKETIKSSLKILKGRLIDICEREQKKEQQRNSILAIRLKEILNMDPFSKEMSYTERKGEEKRLNEEIESEFEKIYEKKAKNMAEKLFEKIKSFSIKKTHLEFEKKGLDVYMRTKYQTFEKKEEILKEKSFDNLYDDYRPDSYRTERYYNGDRIESDLYLIEIKPVVSDDFPAILRQMKKSGAFILLIGEYNGIGATREEFIEYFKTQGIKVVFETDVEAYELPNKELPSFDELEIGNSSRKNMKIMKEKFC